MADMPGDFWSGWIVVLTVVSLLGLAWLVFSVYFSDTGPQEAEAQVWDETLREGANPAPMWWFWMILILMVFSAGYLMLYPGLGSFKGALRWSQASHHEHRAESYEAAFGQLRRDLAARPIEELQQDPLVMQAAQRVYNRNCAACHASDAAGQASLFPDLTDGTWQWGGSAAQIEQSIRLGRNAAMPAWASALGDEGVADVAQYVLAMSGDDADGHPGQERYNQLCVACHGVTGQGNQVLGAPSLADGVWLYGGSEEDVMRSIAAGRNGVMPAFGSRLDDTQIHLLAAWLTRPGSQANR